MSAKRPSSTDELDLELSEPSPPADPAGDTELDIHVPDMTIPPAAQGGGELERALREEDGPPLELAREIGSPRDEGGTRELEPEDTGPTPALARKVNASKGAPLPEPGTSWRTSLGVILALAATLGVVGVLTGVIELGPTKTVLTQTVEAAVAPLTADMVAIPATTFARGCVGDDPGCGEDERPPEMISTEALEVDRTEVTHGDYLACVEAGACAAPSTRDPLCSARHADRPKLPVSCVDASQAAAYCAWRLARLPTALEWELAAKGGLAVIYPWGAEEPRCARANLGGCGGAPLEVGGRADGATAQGALDMAGNVWEWTADGSPARREIRGASYLDGPKTARASNRGFADARTQIPELGFRCVR